jgi:hypothetical protein
MQRAALEFPSLSRQDIDLLDRFIQARKFAKQREKAIMREWRKEKSELKERTI